MVLYKNTKIVRNGAKRKNKVAVHRFMAMRERYYRLMAAGKCLLPASPKDMAEQSGTGNLYRAFEDPEVYTMTRERLHHWYHCLPAEMTYAAEQGMHYIGMARTGCKSNLLAWALDHHWPIICFSYEEGSVQHNKAVLATLLLGRARKIIDNEASLRVSHTEVKGWQIPAEWIQWRKTLILLQNDF